MPGPIITAVVGALAGAAPGIAKHFFPDPADELKRQELAQRLPLAILEHSSAIESAAASIIKAEAESGSWLTRSWRPITMLTFVTLIVARWMGFAAPDLTEAEYLKLWDIVQLGLGGYVVGRTAEKLIPGVVEALKK